MVTRLMGKKNALGNKCNQLGNQNVNTALALGSLLLEIYK